MEQAELEKSILKLTEFVTVSELATMMDISVADIISTCMSLGLFVSINQRLDAETINIVAEEFGFDVEFVSVDIHISKRTSSRAFSLANSSDGGKGTYEA